jgi:hypothetical protein
VIAPARWLAGGLLLALLGGCGGPTPETPAAPEPAAPSGPQLPPRPRTLDLAGVNPCALLTDAQLGTLGVQPGRLDRSNDAAPVHKSSFCIWSSPRVRPDYGYTGGLADNVGAEYALGLEPLRSVQDFAATTGGSIGTDKRWYCSMLVDVGPGRALQVTFDEPHQDDPTMTHERACDRAQQLADAMLTTFQSLPR